MAVQTKSRGERASQRSGRSRQHRGPIAALIGSGESLLRSVGLPIAALRQSRTRISREAYGLALALLALLSVWALGRGAEDGPVMAWWADSLRWTLGRAALLVPAYAALIAVRAFAQATDAILLPRHLIGGGGLAISLAGLLQLGRTGQDQGGALGRGISLVGLESIGQFGSGLVLLVIGVISVFLLAGTDLQTLERDIRRLLPGRNAAATNDEPAVALPAKKQPHSAALNRPVTPPLADREPVINVPTIDRRESVKPKLAERPPASAEGLPLPELTQLAIYDGVAPDTTDLQSKARLIEETLTSFRVDARVREINPGPAVTQFALEPGMGIKVRRITELQNDLALALAAPSIRIEAPVPGMARVGLEIPNPQVATVGLREVLETSTIGKGKIRVPVPLGRDVNGRSVVGDLTRMPHLLIAGATGSGKSVCLNGILSTFLLTKRPEDLKLLLIDPKMVELTGYNGVPHLQCPVVTEMDKVVGALRLVIREMERRYTLFSNLGVRNLDGYRLKTEDEPGAEKIPYLVVIIDELADLMMTAPDEVESLLVRLAQMARATGIHLVLATQRPSVDVLTGLIKANVPARIAFAVSSNTDSRVVLDMPGAERLLGRGDMLYLPPDAAKPQRIQGAFIEDKDISYVVHHWHNVAPIPQYAPEWLELESPTGDGEESDDPLMEQALQIVRQHGTASASMLQRRLRVGYNRAARLIEQMEDAGVIGPAEGLKGRTVLVGED